MRVAQFRTKVFRLGKGERDTTDDSLDYDFESPTLVAGRRWGGGSVPLGPPSVSAPLTARQTAFPKLGAAGQTPAHRLPVGRQTANITVVDLQGNPVRQFGRVGEGPGEFSGVRNVWALTVCSGQSVAVHDAWRRVWFFSVQTASRAGIRPGGPGFFSIPGLHCEAASQYADHGLKVDGFVLLQRILPLVDDLCGVHYAQHLAGAKGLRPGCVVVAGL